MVVWFSALFGSIVSPTPHLLMPTLDRFYNYMAGSLLKPPLYLVLVQHDEIGPRVGGGAAV